MASIDDFRIEAHTLLLELDAANIGMMMLVSSRCVSGPVWDDAVERHSIASKRWDAFTDIRSQAART